MREWILIIVGFLAFWALWQVFWRVTWAIGDINHSPFLPFVLYGAFIYWWIGRRKRKSKL